MCGKRQVYTIESPENSLTTWMGVTPSLGTVPVRVCERPTGNRSRQSLELWPPWSVARGWTALFRKKEGGGELKREERNVLCAVYLNGRIILVEKRSEFQSAQRLVPGNGKGKKN